MASSPDRVQKIVVDSKSVDGLRATAAMHVMLGHFLLFTDWKGELGGRPRSLGRSINLGNFESAIDLMGGGSMGLFYSVSGFVMMFGYGQVRFRSPSSIERHACDLCNCCCCVPFETCCARGLCTSEWQIVEQDSSISLFKQAEFVQKRIARLAPMYYITNVLVLIMMLIAMPPGDIPLILLWAVLSAFGVTSWISLPPPNLVAWTIPTMAFFYLCFPSVVLRLQRLKQDPTTARSLALRMYCTQLVLGLATVALGTAVYEFENHGLGLHIVFWLTRAFPPLRLPVFIMGCCCACQVLQRERGCRTQTDQEFLGSKLLASCFCLTPSTGLLLWFLGACAACTLLAHFGPAGVRFHYLVRILLELALPILFHDWILSLTDEKTNSESVIAKLFRTQLFLIIADISMSLYLIHFFVIILLSFFGNGGAFLGMPWWGILIGFPVSLGLGWSLTRFAERPLQRAIRGDKRKAKSPMYALVIGTDAAVGKPVKVSPEGSSCHIEKTGGMDMKEAVPLPPQAQQEGPMPVTNIVGKGIDADDQVNVLLGAIHDLSEKMDVSLNR